MAYIITEPCIGTKDKSCVDVCPVDCIHPTKDEPELEKAENVASAEEQAEEEPGEPTGGFALGSGAPAGPEDPEDAAGADRVQVERREAGHGLEPI